jgi:hypothetical protein
MSGYNGRHGPNVSKYVANLNTIPTQQDLLAEPLNIEEDLALFTNNDFIDWNENDNLDTSLDFLNTEQQQQQQRPGRQHAVTSHVSVANEPKMDYPMTGKCRACHYVSMSCSHIVLSSLLLSRSSLSRVRIASSLAQTRVCRTPPNSLHCTIAPHAWWPFTALSHRAPCSAAASRWRITLPVTQL